MTGSAKIARFIAAVLCVWTLHSMPGQCAAPRDALKYLQFNHESRFTLREHDIPTPSYTDAYTGSWTLDWKPPPIVLPQVGALGYKFHYRQIYTDNLDKIAKTGRDSRIDHYKVNLNLQKMKPLTLTYFYDRSDTFQNGFKKNSSTIQSTNIGIPIPNFPKLDYGSTSTITSYAIGPVINSATEANTTSYKAQFRRNVGPLGQEYNYQYMVKSGTAGAPKSGFSQFNGYRQFNFAGFGKLQFDYRYAETNKIQGTSNDLSNTNWYSVTLNNSLGKLPLDYNFSLSSSVSSLPNSDSSTEIKSISLNYKPPVPEGKQLSINFKKQMREDFPSNSRHTSEDLTSLQWRFRTNPRTQGGLRYSQTLKTDVLARVFTNKNENMSGNLSYSIPGNQGEMNASLGHLSVTNPSSKRSKDSIMLNNTFKLGQFANMTFFYSQFYDGSIEPRSDSTLSGFHYKLSRKNGISLDARWQQNMSRATELSKSSVQNLALHFRYQPSTFLSYAFLVNQNGTADTMNFNKSNHTYQSKNEIEFKVRYTF